MDKPIAQLAIPHYSHLIYSQAALSPGGTVLSSDHFIDFELKQLNDAGQSVKGNYNGIKSLKSNHPDLNVMLSIGGWAQSNFISDIAADENKTATFIQSALALKKSYGFDGFEIDWRFPGFKTTPNQQVRANDVSNYLLLIRKLRQACQDCVLSITVPDKALYRVNWDFSQFAKHVSFFNLIAHEYHGAWNKNTGHKAPLFSAKNRVDDNIARAVKELFEQGLPNRQLVISITSLGMGWQGVEDIEQGLGQSYQSIPMGTYDDYQQGATGKFSHQHIQTLLQDSTYRQQWHEQAKASSLYNREKAIFISYESNRSLAEKLLFSAKHQLAGMAISDIIADSSDKTSLSKQIHQFEYPFYARYLAFLAYIKPLMPWLFALIWLSLFLLTAFLIWYGQKRWYKKQFDSALVQLPELSEQLISLISNPAKAVSLTDQQQNSVNLIALKAAQLSYQLPQIAKLQPKQQHQIKETLEEPLAKLEAFTLLMQKQDSLSDMLASLFNFLKDEHLVSGLKLIEEHEVVEQIGHCTAVKTDGEPASDNEQIPSLIFSHDKCAAQITDPDHFDFHLHLTFSQTLTEQQTQYFSQIAHLVTLARKQVRKLIKQPQLLAELHEISQHKDDILFIQGARGYSGIYCKNKTNPSYIYLSLRAIRSYFPDLLVQVHRSYLINPRYISGLNKNKASYSLLLAETLVPIGRSYLKKLRTHYPNWFE
ncbi:LytTR family transcriptional regulator DNA-binding domain-containing protein [Catenovulum sp. SM1970]|nr:LytTR family transcriptional regulator DNA-binding domain-containing protein [Marinifaba aquimaris]